MRIAHLSFVVVVLLVNALAAGCSTMSIGRPPSDLDLRNDGSSEAQTALQRKYAIVYRAGFFERPGATPEVIEAEINVPVDAVRSGAWSDEATDYLASSPVAFDATDTSIVGFDRFAHSGTPVLILEAGGVLVGTAVGATVGIVSAPANQTAVVAINDVASAAFVGAFTGLLISLPLVIVYDWSVPSLSTALSASDYRRGVRAFNQDLERRIVAQAPKASPVPVEPAAPPPASDERQAPVDAPAP